MINRVLPYPSPPMQGDAGDSGSLGQGRRCPGGGNDSLFQNSCRENLEDRGSPTGCSPWGSRLLETSEWQSTHAFMKPLTQLIFQMESNKSLHCFCIIYSQPFIDDIFSFEFHRALAAWFLLCAAGKALFQLLLRWLTEVCFILEENNLSEITCCAMNSVRAGTLYYSQFVSVFP